LIDYLRDKGGARLKQVKASFRKEPVDKALAKLHQQEIVSWQSVLSPPTSKAKTNKVAHLCISANQIDKTAHTLGKSVKKADLLQAISARPDDPISVRDALKLANVKNNKVLNDLLDEGLIFLEPDADERQELIFLDASEETVMQTLMQWRGSEPYVRILRHIAYSPRKLTPSQIMRETDTSRAQLNKLVANGLIEFKEEQVWRDSLADHDFVPTTAPQLTPDQQDVWDVVRASIQAKHGDSPTNARFLLHGVTGSGKTEIYLRAIEQTLAQGRQAIFLVPEIALTSQTIRRVAERFPEQVAIVHGSLPTGERYDTWQRARTGDVGVIVGTRSALFTPLPDIGLIILDEEHDASYKQDPPVVEPHYHARDTAEKLMESNHGVLILGSATPDIVTYHYTKRGHYTYLHLPNRIMGHRQRIEEQAERVGVTAKYHSAEEDALHIDLPPVHVVDMRKELRSGNVTMFSRELQEGLETVLERGEQAMLLLNRRGQSTYVFCRDCGYVVMCSNCDSPMTYHRQGEAMRCHHCGYVRPTPKTCSSCSSTRIKFFGAGTQQVQAALKELFPQARILRWDADTATKPEIHRQILQKFIDREADIVIGTQMIAKGLDLPLVTLVGVVSADLGLALPDYRAGERVFQLLTQVAGRAGRGVLGGKVVLQTYQPQHYVIQYAAKHDYLGFVEQELAYRHEMGYPPYRKLARVVFQFTDAYKTQKEAEEGARRVQILLDKHEMTGTELIGPAPCFFTRIDRYYRWHLLLRGPNPSPLLKELRLERGWQLDIDPVDVL
jgi:primosomal protein N' (replication factor Y)